VTPFLLARVADLTGGRSKTANLALLRNNARVARIRHSQASFNFFTISGMRVAIAAGGFE